MTGKPKGRSYESLLKINIIVGGCILALSFFVLGLQAYRHHLWFVVLDATLCIVILWSLSRAILEYWALPSRKGSKKEDDR